MELALESFDYVPLTEWSASEAMLLLNRGICLLSVPVDIHGQYNQASNEALCLEILGVLKRCMSQQSDIRLHLYQGLVDVLSRNTQLKTRIMDMLHKQVKGYYECDEDTVPPLKLEGCITANGKSVFLSEPLSHLLSCIQQCVHKVKMIQLQVVDDDEDDGDAEEGESSSAPGRSGLEEFLNSLTAVMVQADMEDFELDKAADFSTANSVGVRNNIFAILLLGSYEVLMEHNFTAGDFSVSAPFFYISFSPPQNLNGESDRYAARHFLELPSGPLSFGWEAPERCGVATWFVPVPTHHFKTRSQMKRSVALYIPVFLFLPLIIVLYVVTERSLDVARSKDTKGKQGHNNMHLMPTLLVRAQDRLQQSDNSGQRAVDNMELAMEANSQSSDKGQGQVPKWVPARVTFPPYVASVNNLGTGGQGVTINVSSLTAEEKTRYDLGWKHNSFNQFLSDMVSVHRPLPHGWSTQCKEKTFRSDLPEVSVIIIFHNEAWTVLLRSVHSVLSRTPKDLLREVILVDDLSTFDHLKAPLDLYWKQTDKRVKIVHAHQRMGLTRARLLGYEVATAPLLVFFDSHIECFPGWLEPLADRIVSHPNITVFPSIEAINANTLKVELNHNVGVLGVFSWRDLTFAWANIPAEQQALRTSPADPIRSPTMPGGLFAISRQFFSRLGTYDPALQYWGGENIELSFKAWMCYGAVELIPCSHVGHIYRKSNPITWHTDVGLKNVARVAEVWMDDYKNYFLERNLFKVGDYGDVTERRNLRAGLQCRDFAWYVRNVLPVTVVPQQVIHAGELRLKGKNLCIDSYGPKSTVPRLDNCHGEGGNQFWYMSEEGDVWQDEQRLCANNGTLTLNTVCNDRWNNTSAHQLIHKSTAHCLQAGVHNKPITEQRDLILTLQPCDEVRPEQKWLTKPRSTDHIFPSFTG